MRVYPKRANLERGGRVRYLKHIQKSPKRLDGWEGYSDKTSTIVMEPQYTILLVILYGLNYGGVL